MAGSVNKVILVGNLGRDPESRSFQNGGKVVELRIATSESWKDRNSGERKEKTEWHTVKVFNEGLANVAERYLRKGSKVYIEFPRRIDQGEAPPLFIVGPDGGNQLVNYRVRGNYYIVDRPFAAAELRLGNKQQEVVRIARTDGRQLSPRLPLFARSSR